MGFLTIIEDDQTFDFTPVDPVTGARTDTVLTLRMVPDTVLKDLRRRCMTRSFENHQKIEQIDELALMGELVDYAIVDWRGVKSVRDGKDLPCTTEMKGKLPIVVKTTIVKMCAAKEAGAELSQIAEEKKLYASTSNGKSTNSPISPVV